MARSAKARSGSGHGSPLIAGVAAGVAAGAGAGAAYALRRRRRTGLAEPRGAGIRAHGVVTVRGTPEQVYARWRDLPKLPHVLTHLHEVSVLDTRRSRWTAIGAEGRRVTWDVEITDDVPGRELAWRSLPPAAVPTEGHVRFAPARRGRGTAIHLDLSYTPAAGRDSEWAVLQAADEREIRRDLRRFKRTAARTG